jgi:hypothetical protein
LARFKGISREQTSSDLNVFFTWCAERGVEPLAAQRTDLELFVRWMQETRRFKPSTVARRTSVLAGFYRTCVIDGVLDHSPAEHVRRPTVPPESPTLGPDPLQFEAMLNTARDSSNVYDFALIAMLGLLGLRIFEATGADIADLGEEHGHPSAAGHRQGHQGGAGAAAIGGGAGHRPRGRNPHQRADPAEHPWHVDTGTPPPAGCDTRRHSWCPVASDASAHAPPHLRHDHARRQCRLA